MPGNFVSAAVAANDAATAAQYNNLRTDSIKNSGDYAASTGSANAYVLAVDTAIAGAYATGEVFKFKANFQNTGAATLNVNTLGAITIKKNHDIDLESGDIENGQFVTVMYDGTNFQLLSPTAIEISSVNKAILTGGSDADALHYHPNGFHGYNATLIYPNENRASAVCGCGYSYEAGVEYIAIGAYANIGGGGQMYAGYKVASEYGTEIYQFGRSSNSANVAIANVLYANGHYWTAKLAGDTVAYRDGTGVTFGSNACSGAMSWDNGSSYLMFLNTTTNIRRFTYSVTTLTFVDNITLDTAVTIDKGWVFDDVNNMFYFLDTTANLIRKFNQSGVTQSTTAYTFDDTNLVGIVAIDRRIYFAIQEGNGNNDSSSAIDISAIAVRFIPSSITF